MDFCRQKDYPRRMAKKTIPKKKAHLRPLTIKEKKLIQLKAQGLPHHEAYRQVYSATAKYSTATQNTVKILKKPPVKAELARLLAKHDITIENAIIPIAKALTAKKQNQFTGEITEDYASQLKASDRALRLLGVNESSGAKAIFLSVINSDKKKYNL